MGPRKQTWACAALTLFAACSSSEPASEWTWQLPDNFPEPRVPDDNPMNAAKVELGRRLFYDTRLSGNETQSCASCHVQELAFADGQARAVGSTGEMHPRGAMGLTNVAYVATLAWANPLLRELEEQALVPMFGDDPVELGLGGKEDVALDRLRSDADYPNQFAEAFSEEPGDENLITIKRITQALAAFERTLISGNAPYDRFLRGDSSALSEDAQRGLDLFFSEQFECFHCHGGFNFSNSVDHDQNVFDQAAFHNNGLYNTDGRGAYPTGNQGVYEFSTDRKDLGRFKAPTLRNIERTAPYMHDGSIATLEEVLEHYAAGGRNVTEGPNIGDGREHPNKSQFVRGFEMSDDEQQALLAFLRSLTDEEFLTDPRFSDPG